MHASSSTSSRSTARSTRRSRRASRRRRATSLPANVLLRARYDGTKVTAEFSGDDGATWTLIGQPGHGATLAGSAARRHRLVPRRQRRRDGVVRLGRACTAGPSADTPITCAPSCSTQSDQFNGTTRRPEVVAAQPGDGLRADRRRRSPDAAGDPGRLLRRHRDRADAAAGRALGLVGGDGEDRPRQHQRRRRGGRVGADQQPQPESLPQDDAPVQGRHRTRIRAATSPASGPSGC